MTSLARDAESGFLINQNDFFFLPQGVTGELCCQVKVSSQPATIEEMQQNEAEAAASGFLVSGQQCLPAEAPQGRDI